MATLAVACRRFAWLALLVEGWLRVLPGTRWARTSIVHNQNGFMHNCKTTLCIKLRMDSFVIVIIFFTKHTMMKISWMFSNWSITNLLMSLVWRQSIHDHTWYLSFLFTQAKFLENKIYTKKRVNYDKIHSKLPIFCVITAKYTVNCQFFALNL